MKKKSTAVIGMLVCFMMIASMAWALNIPGVPNGTVTDGTLVWLQNAECFGRRNWNDATSAAASLKSGSCGLTDGSKAGQWRLPTKDELERRTQNKRYACWSSSTWADDTTLAWVVILDPDFVEVSYKDNLFHVCPVRAGQ